MKSKRAILGFLAVTSMFICTWTHSSTEGETAWFKKTQVYSMAALPPGDVAKFNITVNGLWNGYIGEISSPFAFGRMLESLYSGHIYNTDKEFVDTLHSLGQIVPGTILTSQGHTSMQGERLAGYACRSASGAISDFDLEAGSQFMCAIHGGFKDWMIRHGKRAIDAGADLIVLDEIQGNSLFPMFQLFAAYIGMQEPGFCRRCIETFRLYLKNHFSSHELNKQFNIKNIDTFDLHTRIAETKSLFFKDRVAADPLNQVYFDHQEEKNFRAKRKVVQALRDYAKKRGKDIAISANSYTLGTHRSGGYWSKGLIYSDMLDFYTFENAYSALEDVSNPSFPRSKWLSWLKLARAATGSPAVVLPDTRAVKEIVENTAVRGKSYSNYLYIRCAEAYANRCALANYYIKAWGDPNTWRGVSRVHRFIANHKYLYDTRSETQADVAFLFLHGSNLKRRLWSYLGLTQALAESHIPFDVVFGGGGEYLKDRLKKSDISDYELLVIPTAHEITVNQRNLIDQYVRDGGKAITFDPETFNIQGIGGIAHGSGLFIVVPTWEYAGEEWDVGYLYFTHYENKIKRDIAALVESVLPQPSILNHRQRMVVAYPHYQAEKKRIVVHLVNYDHDRKTDKVTPKSNLILRLKKPDFTIKGTAYVISPDFKKNVTLSPEILEKRIEVKIPELKVYDIVVIK